MSKLTIRRILNPAQELAWLALGAAAWLGMAAATARAQVIIASDGAASDQFGNSVSQLGSIGLVGANNATVSGNFDQGAAYLFRNLNTASGTVTQNAKLIASDGAASASFGVSVSQSGSIGLVGAHGATVAGQIGRGAAYLFRNLDTAAGTVTQNVKLIAAAGAAFDDFGTSVSLSGNIGLVGADEATVLFHPLQGAAYVFRNLNTASGTVTEDAKLTAEANGVSSVGFFGGSVSISGSNGLVGADASNVGGINIYQGAAFLFHNLNTASGTVFQGATLLASDGALNDYFGNSVSLSGNIGLVGAFRATVSGNASQGAAYLFRNLDTGFGTVTQNVKLIASDGAANDNFGVSVSQSGSIGLVGAYSATIGSNSGQGAAYLFRNLDTASGTVTQNVKLTASDGAANDNFGFSVSLSGDQFTIGAVGANLYTGKAYTGTVSSVTTLDAGSTSRKIDGISFVSQNDWIIGQTTSGNAVTLLAGNTANVTASGKAVYIGQNAGSNNNTLKIAGTLTTGSVDIGLQGFSTGNIFQLENTAILNANSLLLATSNSFRLSGDYSNISNLLTYLGSDALEVWDGGAWDAVNATNYSSLISSSYDSGTGYSTINPGAAVPEPGTLSLLCLAAMGLLAFPSLRARCLLPSPVFRGGLAVR